MTTPPAGTSRSAGASSSPDEDQRSAFGQELEQARKERGWSVDDAATRAGIARKTWARLEDGFPVRVSTLRDLETAFHAPEGSIARAYYGTSTLRDALSQPLPPTTGGGRPASPTTVEDVFESAQQLDLPDLLRLRERIDAVVTYLSARRSRSLEDLLKQFEELTREWSHEDRESLQRRFRESKNGLI
ncbi:helix-turn-helix domain-containing protein [Actinokineospora spheciospongiae]|uniref:helix-turn-helix domain-containing protein n=1 Tax=Actinokineospora spheciospongiae TaxID=909613 RepID=UPI000D717650|nr:helix-turn-helix transcriptional regulator [Actinokineospora spheciospongiae]